MAYEQKDLTGSLFKNDRREKDTHPNAKGTALIDGVEYWVDAWTNETRDGTKYQSLKFKRKDSARQGIPATNEHAGYTPANSTAMGSFDDEVPF